MCASHRGDMPIVVRPRGSDTDAASHPGDDPTTGPAAPPELGDGVARAGWIELVTDPG
jgi:hypothetical protein